MYYIFDKNSNCMCSCDNVPNISDLTNRGESALYSDLSIDFRNAGIKDGQVVEVKREKTIAEIKADMWTELNKLKMDYAENLMLDNTEKANEIKVKFVELNKQYDKLGE